MSGIRIARFRFVMPPTKLRRFITKPANWLLGVAGVAVTGLVAGYMTDLFDKLLPSPGRIACAMDEWGEKKAPGTHFTILISDLTRDSDGRQTALVEQAFEDLAGVHVFRTCYSVGLDTHGWQHEAKHKAASVAYELLQAWDADLLVWGDVIAENKALRIHFVNWQGAYKIGLKPYAVHELELHANFDEDFGNQLVVAASSQMLIDSEEQFSYVASILEPRVVKLERLVDQKAHRMTASQLGSLYSTLAIGKFLIGMQRDDVQALGASSALLEQAVTAFEEGRDRKLWTTTQLMLGEALAPLFQYDRDIARLEKAIIALDAALSAISRDEDPGLWGLAQMHLGFVLFNYWTISNDGALAGKAVAALDQALLEVDQQQAPHEWALANGMRAVILAGFSAAAQDHAELHRSAESLRASLSVFDRNKHSQIWGTFELSLGGALSFIGDRERGTAVLQESIEHLELALTEFTKQRSPRKWVIITVATSALQAEVGKRRRDAALVKEAVGKIEQVKSRAVARSHGARLGNGAERAELYARCAR